FYHTARACFSGQGARKTPPERSPSAGSPLLAAVTAAGAFSGAVAKRLLFFVDRGAGGFLSVGDGLRGHHGTGRSVRLYRDFRGEAHFAAFLAGGFQRVVVDFLVGAGVGQRIAGDRIVLAVVLPGPLVVGGLAIGSYAIECDFHAVARDFVGD